MDKLKNRKTWRPYELDTFSLEIGKEKPIELAAITKKNSNFIEAVIRLDSNYGWDADPKNACQKGYIPFDENNNKCFKNKKGYYGSTAYWFLQMENGDDFERCIKGAIVSIDITNSTRMSYKEREELADRLIGTCKSVEELKKKLEEPFSADKKEHILAMLANKTNSGTRFNLSFASKFCSYGAAYLLLNQNLYSKYDNIVSAILPHYARFYGVDTPKERYKTKIDSVYSSKFSDKEDFEYRLCVYQEYNNIIGEIIENSKCDGITRDQFDHIVWYSQK